MDTEDQSTREQAAQRFEREQRLEEITAGVDTVRDDLGKPIDPGIRDAVIALRAQALAVDFSCEGHPGKREKKALPWVSIEAPAPDGWRDSPALQDQWRQENEAQAARVRQLLAEWYEEREKSGEVIPPDLRLTLAPRGDYGSFRIESVSQTAVSSLKFAKRHPAVAPHRTEMGRFTEYLREKFLAGG